MTLLDNLGISAPWMRVMNLDPVQWERWYSLLVKPNRAKQGLYILHDQGSIVTVTPAYAQSLLQLPSEIDDPETAAAELYSTWQRGPVVIFERKELRRVFDIIQRDRTEGDDFFSFMLKTIGHFSGETGPVIHPDPFANWRGSISPAFPHAFAHAIAPEGTSRSIVLAIYDGEAMWASMLLGFTSGKLEMITTLPIEPISDWRQDYQRLLPMAESQFAPAALGLFFPLEVVQKSGVHPQSWHQWLAAAQSGKMVCKPGNLDEIIAHITEQLQSLPKE